MSQEQFRNHYLRGQKEQEAIKNNVIISAGRPPKLKKNQEIELVEFIINSGKRNNIHFPPTELNAYVENKYQLQVNSNFSNDFIKTNKNRLQVVEASPMEAKIIDVNREDLEKYMELDKFIKKIHPK